MAGFPLFADLVDPGAETPEEVRWAHYVNACQALVAEATSTGASRGQVAHAMSEEVLDRLFGQGWLEGRLVEAKAWEESQDRGAKRAYLLEVVQLGPLATRLS